MRILFTKNNSIVSRLIRRVTGEPVSHCVVDCGGWIIHSNFLGVHVELIQSFEKSSEIVFECGIPYDTQRVMSALAAHEGAMYDFGGMAYLGLKCLFPFLPKKNLWQHTGMYLCTEWVTEILDGRPDSMITPYQLYLKLSQSKEN